MWSPSLPSLVSLRRHQFLSFHTTAQARSSKAGNGKAQQLSALRISGLTHQLENSTRSTSHPCSACGSSGVTFALHVLGSCSEGQGWRAGLVALMSLSKENQVDVAPLQTPKQAKAVPVQESYISLSLDPGLVWDMLILEDQIIWEIWDSYSRPAGIRFTGGVQLLSQSNATGFPDKLLHWKVEVFSLSYLYQAKGYQRESGTAQ